MKLLALIMLGVLPTLPSQGFTKGAEMDTELPRASAEEMGVSSAELLPYIQSLDKEVDSLHGLVLVRHGRVVAEGWWAPYDAETPHQLWSLTKSFTSMAVGLAISEGRFALDDPILSHFPAEAAANPSANLKAMRVRDLLCMSTGHEAEPGNDGWSANWKTAFFAQPVPFKPGTHFLYNTPASGILAALVEKTAKTSLPEYLKPRLFEPLGIHETYWWKAADGTTTGGFGLHLTTGEIARFGQLLLQKGVWNGRQVLPADWIASATSKQVSNGDDPNNDWAQGYGYQFWMCRNGFFRGDGAFGQFCIVMPRYDAVLAVTSGTGDMGKVMQLTWDKLLPALKPSALPPDPKALQGLRKALQRLSLAPVKASAPPPAGVAGRTWLFAENPRKLSKLSLEAGKYGATVLAFVRDGREWRIECGADKWIRGEAPWGEDWPESVSASGGWTAPDTFTARICHLDSTFVHTVRLVFRGDEVTIENEVNVAFGPTRKPDLKGIAESRKGS